MLALVDHLDAMVAYWNEDRVCVFANDAYRHWFGKTKEEVIGLTMEQLLGPLYLKNLPYIQAAFEGRVQVFEREIPAPDGRIRHSLATYTPHIVEGEVQGIFVHVADVTSLKKLEHELKRAKEQAEELATHDFLTGLPNRVLLLDRIAQALELARRNQRMVAVLSLDMDDLKIINDTYGHGAGDQLLVEIARRLKDGLRKSDSVTRLGGDEFVVLVPEVESISQVETMVAHLLEKAGRPFDLTGTSLSPTFSVGVAIYPRDGTTPETLIASSDRALYVAKRLGKNRLAYADQSAAR